MGLDGCGEIGSDLYVGFAVVLVTSFPSLSRVGVSIEVGVIGSDADTFDVCGLMASLSIMF